MDPFSGTSEKVLALLEQLIEQVDNLTAEWASFKQEVRQVFVDLRSENRTSTNQLQTNLVRFVKASDEDATALRTQVDNSIDRKTWLAQEQLRKEWKDQHDALEQSIAELEAAERKRQEGKGA